MNFPEDLKYTKEHLWVKPQEDGMVLAGITDFAQSQLGDLVYVSRNRGRKYKPRPNFWYY